MGLKEEKKETCGTICLKYLLFTFNFLFWLAGGAVMAVGTWTIVEKSDYISLLSSKIYAVSAYILIMAGVIVMVTGVLGCCATFKEQRRLLRVYFVLLLCVFLLEILAGVLAYIYYQQLNEELKENLRETMVQKYHQPEQEHVTEAVDKLQQEFKCCGSNNSSDWAESVWIRSGDAQRRAVPDSCCKSPVIQLCGQRDHPSNIYKVEGGCISKLGNFILNHLQIIGAVGVGIACVQSYRCMGRPGGVPDPHPAAHWRQRMRTEVARHGSVAHCHPCPLPRVVREEKLFLQIFACLACHIGIRMLPDCQSFSHTSGQALGGARQLHVALRHPE